MNTSENEKKQAISRLCETVAGEISPTSKKQKTQRQTRLLKRYLKISRGLYKRATADKKQRLNEAFLWFTDNFYFIEECFLSCIEALKKGKATVSSAGDSYIFLCALRLLKLCEGGIGGVHIDELIICCDAEIEGGLSYDDFSTVGPLLCCAVLCYMGGLFEKMSGRDGIFLDATAGAEIISSIKTLKTVSIHNFSSVLSQCGAERLLMLDPSGSYCKMTKRSQNNLRADICKMAKKCKMNDYSYAEKILKLARQNGDYIGNYVKRKGLVSRLYFFVLFAISFLLTAIVASYTDPRLAILLWFPIFDSFCSALTALIGGGFGGKNAVLPELELESIPDNAKTLCVITLLLRGEEFDSEIFSRLERIYNANSEKNIKFGVLCDLCDFESAVKSTDEALCDYAEGRINSLNEKYGNSFVFLVRRRSYSKGEKCFMPYERKRGAVVELVRLIKGQANTFDTSRKSLLSELDFLHEVKYVITLDADTNLGLSVARRLVGKMLHPANKPSFDKKSKKVIKGYGIMQPRMSTELESARATPFSRLMCGGGGVDIYSGAGFDLYQSLFDSGSFCGKGIFDVDAFFVAIVESDFFPEDRVLSHDIPEGERLRTALLTDIELTDSFPKNELSYLKRKHRWIRGDIQNLIFLFPVIKNGKRLVENDLSLLSKYKLADNVRRAVMPIISFLLISLCALYEYKVGTILALTAILPLAVPFITDAVSLAVRLSFASAARRFFSKGVTSGIWQSFLRMLCFIAMLAKEAFLSLGAVFTALYRMLVSKRGLLEWVTAAAGDSGGTTMGLFISKHLLSSAVGAFMLLFYPGGIVKLFGLAFFIMPLVGCFTSKDLPKKRIKEIDKRKMLAYAKDIWHFFEENVTKEDNCLPPDNISISPYEKTAHRTSPTNIGLYIAAVVCARDFGIIDSNQMHERLTKTISTIEKMPKWRGHLYNWYDTRRLTVLEPSYVSSVDSGNFAACLIFARNAIADYACESTGLIELMNKMDRLVGETDFASLYNNSRQLFSVGATINCGNAVLDESCYDFLMSEARILSYIAVSSRIVPQEHWKRLARPLIGRGGYIGIASWSGTAFEYFMPALFMPIRKGSFLYEAERFAFMAQRNRKTDGVWGISESGFFAFDCDMNYQYKAFGVPTLGQKSGLEKECVLSPYSSFISMCVDKALPLENLSRLARLGMYGKYGFYEAIDFTPQRVKGKYACVKSYMSHHLGMSLLALANASLDGSVTKRFMSDCKMECARELLEEKIPVNAVIKKTKKISSPIRGIEALHPRESISSTQFSYNSPRVACVSDGRASLLVSDCGHFCFLKDGIMGNVFDAKKYPAERPNTLRCYIKSGGRIYGLTPLSRRASGEERLSFAYTESTAHQRLECEIGKFSLDYTILSSALSAARIRLTAETQRAAEFSFVFTPCLDSRASYFSHPSFSELFIKAEYDDSKKILYFIRRKRFHKDGDRVLAVALSDESKQFDFTTKKSSVKSEDLFADSFYAFDFEKEKRVGACINPLCVISGELGGVSELVLVMAHTTKEAERAVEIARHKSFEQSREELFETVSQLTMGAGITSVGSDEAVREMLCGVVFGNSEANRKSLPAEDIFGGAIEKFGKNDLWKHGISGDLPCALLDVGGYYFPTRLVSCVRAFKLLTMKNIRLDLVIAYREKDKYQCKVREKIIEQLVQCSCDSYIGRSGGIHLVEKSDRAAIMALRLCACFLPELYSENKKEKGEQRAMTKAFYPIVSTKNAPEKAIGFDTATGVFFNESFSVNKQAACLPMAFVLSGASISSIVTQSSLGATFCANASEKKLTPRSVSGNSESLGERLYYVENGVAFDLAACASTVKYSVGRASFSGKVCGISYELCVFCDSTLPVKATRVSLDGNFKDDSRLMMCITPVIESNCGCVFCKSDREILFKNQLSECLDEHNGFLKLFYDGECFSTTDEKEIYSLGAAKGDKGQKCLCVGARLLTGSTLLFALGAYKKESGVDALIEREYSDCGYKAENKAIAWCKEMLPKISLESRHKNDLSQSISVMMNTFLPYATIFSRMLARSGFYQTGGAYGFRDQLQDCLLAMYCDNKLALSHIYRSASHQFYEGDVVHWWHSCTNRGVRTLCSDDYLWLPYVCLEYQRLCGDYDFLKVKLPYISGTPLAMGESEKYIPFSVTKTRESLYEHCLKALRLGILRRGEHGLCLMGSCDWCDGYSLVGIAGFGESVWCSMFLSMLLKRFSPLCRKLCDEQNATMLEKAAHELDTAIMRHGYDSENGWFLRGFYDDGTPLGSIKSDEGIIDLLPQSFAVLSGAETEPCCRAMQKARELLFDDEYKITRLLTPPFDTTQKNPGYIKGYLPGVRENGGQYTHGAMFGAMGFFECAKRLYDKDKSKAATFYSYGIDILIYSNPAFRASKAAGEKIASAYLTEPYAVAADIYSENAARGRGGWTHYTGASAWMYRLFLNYYFGIELLSVHTNQARIKIDPICVELMSDKLCGYEIAISSFGFNTKITYRAMKSAKSSSACVEVFCDGKKNEEQCIPKGTTNAEIVVFLR